MTKVLTVFLLKYAVPLVGVVVALSFMVTVVWRVNSYSPNLDVTNIDASYHALLTMKSLQQGDGGEHLFLPIVTLTEDNAEKYISWGSTIPDGKGNYYYTSFPQLGFVVPLLLLNMFHAEITIVNLMYINFLIEAVTIVLLMILVFRISCDLKSTSTVSAIYFAGLIAVAYMFSLEVFYSQGLIYWAQSLMQPILIGQVLSVYAIVMSTRPRAYRVLILGLLILAGTLVEWTGYISAAGIAAYFIYHAVKSKHFSYITYALVVSCSALIGLVAYIVPFIINTSFNEYIAVSLQRFTARNAAASVGPTFEQLILSYFESFGPFIVVVAIGVAILYVDKSSWILFRAAVRRHRYLLLLAALPLLENLIMKQHAYQYSFDRLKLFIPLAILFAIIYVSARSKRIRLVLTIMIVLCVPISMMQTRYSQRAVLNAGYQQTTGLIAKLRHEYPNASYSFSGPVRGWLNLQVGTNIHEAVMEYGRFSESCTRTTCIWLIGSVKGTAQYDIKGAYVIEKKSGHVKIEGNPSCSSCGVTPPTILQ